MRARGRCARARRAESRADAPAVAVEAEAHEVAAAQREVAIEDALLRDVADALRALAGGGRRSRRGRPTARAGRAGCGAARSCPCRSGRARRGTRRARARSSGRPRARASPKRSAERLGRDDRRSSRRARAASARACVELPLLERQARPAASPSRRRPGCLPLRRGADARRDRRDGLAVVEQHLDRVAASTSAVHRGDRLRRRLGAVLDRARERRRCEVAQTGASIR